ncbi:MAG TPA: polysaccharide deacetylase family protein [Candidatus Dojkabacteria bacterium]|nr:polysaccharide deacetylase family protein [Candidatus Dojkabacteria bacterium]HQI92582.1 polysaccharide deacetylase family protein [Candidatus Dojkabacteria bacterium]
MPKKKKAKPNLLDILLISILFLFGIELTLATAYFLKPPIQEIIANAPLITFTFDTSKLAYQQPEITEITPLPSLNTLPKEYSIFTKQYGNLTQHEKTQLLRYSTTTHKTENKTATELYTDIYDNNLNILIPQQYVDIYFLTQLQNIANKFNSLNTLPSVSEELSKIFANDIYFHNDTNIENISGISDFSILSKWLLSSKEITEDNTYTTFLNKTYNKYISTEKMETTDVESSLNDTYTGATYFNVEKTQLSKIDYMLTFLTEVYTQAKLDNKEILYKINTLKQYVQELEDSNGTSIPLKDILSNPRLNTLDTQQPVELLIQTISDKTYLAPIYTFSETFVVNDENFNEPYDVKPIVQSKGSTRVPIFMYHQIGPPPKGISKFTAGLYVTPEQFEEQMAYLVRNNYKTIGSLELYNLLKKGGNPSQKTVMLTFDDGTSGQYEYAFPILKKYGLTATFYVISNRSSIGKTFILKEMSDAGMEIASHSATHPNFVNLKDLDQLTYEIYASKSMLAARTDKPVYGIAYPGCVADSRVYSRVAGAGYLIGASCGRSIDHYLRNRLSLARVHAYGDMESFKKLLSGVN